MASSPIASVSAVGSAPLGLEKRYTGSSCISTTIVRRSSRSA